MLQKEQIKKLREAQQILASTEFTTNGMFRNYLYGGELRGKFFEMSPLDIAIAFYDAHPEFEEEHTPVYVCLTEVEGNFYYGRYPMDQLRLVMDHQFVLNIFYKYGTTGKPVLYWNLLTETDFGTAGRFIYDAEANHLHAVGCCLEQIQGYKDLIAFIVETGHAYLDKAPELVKQFRFFQKVN